MSIPLSSFFTALARPALPILGPFNLARGRVHEICGSARHTLVAMVLQQTVGPVLWMYPDWQVERIHCDGLRDFADPGRLLMLSIRRVDDILWATEEALRSGVVPTVLAELPGPPELTPIRRLNLAAESGAETARRCQGAPPLGLLVTPAEGGATGVESRWHMTTRHEATALRWRMVRLRARSEPPKGWHLEQAGLGSIRIATAQEDRVCTSP